jgi:hypothetical protein
MATMISHLYYRIPSQPPLGYVNQPTVCVSSKGYDIGISTNIVMYRIAGEKYGELCWTS